MQCHAVNKAGDLHLAPLPSGNQKTKGAARNCGPPLLMDELARSGLRDDADDLATAPRTEFHGAVLQREQGVVLAASDIAAGVELGAALTHDDFAGVDSLPTETLDTQALRGRVATVLSGRNALLGCHVCSSLFLLLDAGQDMPVIFTCVSAWRCPSRLRYPVLFLNLWIVILGPLVCSITSPVTETLARASASVVTELPSTNSTAGSATDSPAPWLTRSISMTSPTATFSCVPPLRTIAYTTLGSLLDSHCRCERLGARFLDAA